MADTDPKAILAIMAKRPDDSDDSDAKSEDKSDDSEMGLDQAAEEIAKALGVQDANIDELKVALKSFMDQC